ncbi:M14 family metallopeptidase [Salsipaludibacter albus]|uniref:M14 family metallopeptidase n=1 Tax=Salsipaludibacter albus TaxID=2849650 RepID=UPI001EE4C4F7|nr:M14 family metallopeptidase [Salsipaludibacter albus]MBY5164388.1 immune inhibitor A [Salsipaludibacter albus]
MRWLSALFLSVLLAFSMSAVSVAGPDDPPDAALKAWTADVSPEVVEELRGAGFEITAEDVLDEETVRVEIIATGKQISAFRGPDAKFSLTKGQERVDRTPDVNTGDNVFRPYDGPEGLEAEMVALANANPDLVKLVDIGDSLQGRDIWAMKVSKNANQRPDGTKPAVFYNAAQHAREWITPEMTRRLTRHYLDNYGSDDEITEIVDTTELWFVWVANPDGYQFTHTDERLWRKNLRDNNGDGTITTGDGVDLNRNFATNWGYDNEGSSDNPSSETYRGDGPMSEPETQAMDDFVAAHDFAFMVNYHSAAELILYGVGWQVDTPSPDDLPMIALAGDDANPAIPGYDPDLSAELYITNGDTTDHVQTAFGALAYTPEMSTCQAASNWYPDDEWEAGDCQSGFNFPDDEDLVQEEFENNIPFALDVAKSADDPSDPVSHLGNVAPELVVDTFEISHGSEQVVQVTADRELGPVRMVSRINGGKKTVVQTSEWDGGEKYGDDNDQYYAWRRATVAGQQPGDTVEVWFEARGTKSEPFTYTVADDIGGDVLVVADNSPGTALGGEVPWDAYLPYYTDALEANGRSWDVFRVDDDGLAPHPLGVLGHYDTVVWYTGDKLVTDYQGGVDTTLLAHEVNMAMRDYLNEGGKILATGKNHGFEEFFPLDYGTNGAPDQVCGGGDCLTLSNDTYQYWFGADSRARRGGLDAAGNALDVQGNGGTFEGYTFGLDGGDSANNQGTGDPPGSNTTGTATASFIVTSSVLPVDEFPQFASERFASWDVGAAAPYEPVTGDWQMATDHADAAYKRLTRTIDLSGATTASLDFTTSYSIETNWDYMFVEVHTVGQDDWTTLPDANGHTAQGTGDSCLSGWVDELHPFLAHYIDDACNPTGTTGEWHAATGPSDGVEDWSIDLSAYAGSEIEVSISYATDWATGDLGVFLDDTSVTVDGSVATETSFETDLGGWSVPGEPEGTAPNANDWERVGTLFEVASIVATEDTLLFGFGFEGVTTESERNAVMARALDHLAP